MLLVRVEWLPLYAGEDEIHDRRVPYEGALGELYNFDRRRDGKFYGYLRPSQGERVGIERYFDNVADDVAENATVVFVSQSPAEQSQSLRVVGFYQNAEVHARPVGAECLGKNETNRRMVSRDAYLIPEDMRSYTVDIGQIWGSGSYRGADDAVVNGLVSYIKEFLATDEAQGQKKDLDAPGADVWEWVVISKAERRERRSSASLRNMMLLARSDYKCECCRSKLTANDHQAKERMFEVHHTNPIALLKAGTRRPIDRDDLVVVCANCHRAIHTPDETRYISDLKAFKSEVLNQK